MSQNSNILPTTGTLSGLTMVQDINLALDTLITNNSGASAPSTPQPYMLWANTTSGTLCIRNAGNTAWVTIGMLSDMGIQSSAQITAAAAGTADALTASFTPVITTLTNGMTMYVRAAAANVTTTPSFTPNSGVITPDTIVKGNGLALSIGDIAGAGHWLMLQRDTTLGKWVLLNPATGVSTAYFASIQGAFKNLQCSTTGTTAVVTFSADELVVENTASHIYTTLRALSLTASTGAASGAANSLDTGAWAFSTWYAQYVIWNGTTAALLWSLSATSPTLPTGYTSFARVGWIRTQSATNYNPLPVQQYGKLIWYKPTAGSNLTAPPVMASGAATFPTAVAWATFAPPTASQLRVSGVLVAVSSAIFVAPNTGYTSSTAPIQQTNTSSGGTFSAAVPMDIESANIYYGVSGTANLYCYGWEDNL